MKRRIAPSPALTVKTLVAGTLLSTKPAPRRNVRVVAGVAAVMAVIAGVAAVIAAAVAAGAVAVIAETVEIAATAGNALFFVSLCSRVPYFGLIAQAREVQNSTGEFDPYWGCAWPGPNWMVQLTAWCIRRIPCEVWDLLIVSFVVWTALVDRPPSLAPVHRNSQPVEILLAMAMHCVYYPAGKKRGGPTHRAVLPAPDSGFRRFASNHEGVRNITQVDVFDTPGEEIPSLAPAWSIREGQSALIIWCS